MHCVSERGAILLLRDITIRYDTRTLKKASARDQNSKSTKNKLKIKVRKFSEVGTKASLCWEGFAKTLRLSCE